MRSADGSNPYIPWGITLGVVLFLMYVYPGFVSPVTPHFDGSCKPVELGAAAEDLRIDPATGVAYLSYYDRFPAREAGARSSGTVMLMDLNIAEPRARAALTTEPPGFSPQGLSLYTPLTGPKRLFVVSRSKLGSHAIEIFEQTATGAFAPVETLRHPSLWSPNGIVAVGPRQFYVTNDSGFRDRDAADKERQVERRLRDNRSNVLYYDGQSFRRVADRLDMANGIAVSRDSGTLYVGEATGRKLTIFQRNVSSGDLRQVNSVNLDGAPDNLTVDADGSVWIASHPRLTQLRSTLRDPAKRSPSQVLKYVPGRNVSEEIYLNDGEQISASTVAAPFHNLLVIGSVTDHRVLVCQRQGLPPVITGPEKET